MLMILMLGDADANVPDGGDVDGLDDVRRLMMVIHEAACYSNKKKKQRKEEAPKMRR